ncbi:MAG TPA: transketolase C-terminal domain-containing protein [Bordetella sp.]|nr:transketolase C-terminal domain-containing protein [Bordetella sp.]
MNRLQANLAVNDFTDRSSQPAVRRLYGEALLAAARNDPRIVALTADLSGPTETDLFRDALPDRFYQAGIAEANMVGMAGGMARCGYIPFVHTFSVFATRRAYDQVAMQLAYPGLNAKVVGFIPGLDTLLGASHQAIDDVALMRALPGMRVLEPAPGQAGEAVQEALAYDGPVYLRLARAGGASTAQPYPAARDGLASLRTGRDGLLLASGLSIPVALDAAAELARRGKQLGVVAVTSMKPLNPHIADLARNVRTVVTVENHSIIGGLGSAVAELLMEQKVSVNFARIGVRDTFAYGATTPYLMAQFGLDAPAVVRTFQEQDQRA